MSFHRASTLPKQPRIPLDGTFLRPGDPDFDRARLAWNLAVDQQPAAILTAISVADVAAGVAIANEEGLRLTAQGTGHGAAALGALEDTILLRTDRLRSVEVDAARGVVRVGAGVRWGEAIEAAGHHGLALLAGSSPDVGVAGYTLGGGLSWLSRRHGLACNSVEAFELVTADGRVRRADAEHEPDLFWALRGGGGSFGVVTAIELRALQLTDLYAGLLWWPIERGEEVLHCWLELAEQDPPEELTTVGRYLRLPDLAEIPAALRGRSFVVIEAYHLGDPAEADELLAPLRSLGPESDTIQAIPACTLTQLSLDPEDPVPAIGDGMLLAELDPEAIDTFVRAAGAGSDSPLLSVEIRQLGGELSRARPAGGALASLDARYAMFAVGIAPSQQAGWALRAFLDDLRGELAPWAAPRMYMNFAETRREEATLWSEHAQRRLRQIKARIDPDDLIRANHPVRPGSRT